MYSMKSTMNKITHLISDIIIHAWLVVILTCYITSICIRSTLKIYTVRNRCLYLRGNSICLNSWKLKKSHVASQRQPDFIGDGIHNKRKYIMTKTVKRQSKEVEIQMHETKIKKHKQEKKYLESHREQIYERN